MERRIPAGLTPFTPRDGRKFAFPVGTAFLVLAGIVWWREHLTLATAFASLTGLLYLSGLLIPGKLGPVYRAWMGFAHAISKVTTPIVMGITYFIVLTPIGIVIRLLGKNPLNHAPEDGSFWVARPEGAGRKSDLNRLF